MEAIVEVYEDDAGNRPFDDWFDALPSAHAAKVVVAAARLEAGNRSNLKPVGKGVLEWRIDWGPGLRIYAGFDGARMIILLGGGSKVRQQMNIATAQARWADYKRRKKIKE